MTNIIWFILLPFSLGEIAFHSHQLLILMGTSALLFVVLYRHRLTPHFSELLFSVFAFGLGYLL